MVSQLKRSQNGHRHASAAGYAPGVGKRRARGLGGTREKPFRLARERAGKRLYQNTYANSQGSTVLAGGEMARGGLSGRPAPEAARRYLRLALAFSIKELSTNPDMGMGFLMTPFFTQKSMTEL